MYSLILLGILSIVFSLILTPLCRNLFRRLRLLDQPDAGRKIHAQAIPRIGGLPIALSYLAAFGVLLLTPLRAGDLVREGLPLAWKLLPAAGIIWFVGLLDDILGLRPWQKLSAQFAAAALAWQAGIQIHNVTLFPIHPWLGVPLTMFWLICCANAFNLIDGIDGLAAGVGLFATVTTVIAAFIQGNVALAIATVPLAGCILGFLRYNFNPASIFLGDSGSLLIGFLLGCYSVLWSQKSATILGMTAPMMALIVPLLDTGLAVGRRFLRQRPIFAGDRGHIHHRLLARGLTPRRAALILYAACAVGAVFSILQSFVSNQLAGLVVLVFCAVAWIGIQHLGYVEFGIVTRMMVGGGFRSLVSAELELRQFQDRLAAAVTPDERWLAIRDASRAFGFSGVQAKLSGCAYSDPDSAPNSSICNIDIRLPDGDYVRLSRELQPSAQSMIVGAFAEALYSGLGRAGDIHSYDASSHFFH